MAEFQNASNDNWQNGKKGRHFERQFDVRVNLFSRFFFDSQCSTLYLYAAKFICIIVEYFNIRMHERQKILLQNHEKPEIYLKKNDESIMRLILEGRQCYLVEV